MKISSVIRNSKNEELLREACNIAITEGRSFEIREYWNGDQWMTEFKIEEAARGAQPSHQSDADA